MLRYKAYSKIADVNVPHNKIRDEFIAKFNIEMPDAHVVGVETYGAKTTDNYSEQYTMVVYYTEDDE